VVCVVNFRSTFACCWRPLIATDLGWKLLGLLILGPLSGLMFQGILFLSGKPVLADEEIAFFFLASPMGWFGLLLLGALLVGLLALNQVALMSVIHGAHADGETRFTTPFRFALSRAVPVLLVTAHLVVRAMLLVLPFLLLAAATYSLLLTEYDINFYLQARPPAFVAAVGIGMVLGGILVALLLILAARWILVLPLVAFEGVKPREALAASSHRTRDRRRRILGAVFLWLLAFLVISWSTTSLLVGMGEALIAGWTGSLAMLTAVAGLVLVLLTLNALVTNVLGTTSFAVLLYTCYREEPVSRRRHGAGGPGFRLRPVTVMMALLLVSCVVGLTGYTILQRIHVDADVQVIAHRGASARAPENTLAAIQGAIEDGADWVEIDVQETADDRVVVFHDSDFKKTAGNPLNIWDATETDLADLNIGSWFAAEFADQRVPSLKEVLELCRGRTGVLIELKYYGHDRKLEQRVLDIVTAAEMDDTVRLMSLKPAAVAKLKQMRPDLPSGLLLSVVAGKTDRLEADFLAVNAALAERAFIASVHRQGREVYVWTVNDVPTLITLLSRGVDGVITDRPAMARAVLAAWLDMEPVERLVLDMAAILGVLPDGGELELGDEDA
jgi:glycerophosphoryl diester phosphodiesterase